MAKHNVVYLYGVVTGAPTIYIDDKTGEYKKGIAHLALIRPEREFGINTDIIRYDKPMIYSGDPEMITKMAKWQENDLIWLKGAITTLNIQKVTICSNCGMKNKQPGEFCFITPIYTECRKTGLTESDALNDLKNHQEVSNQVFLIGYLCDDVYHNGYENKHYSTYQIAVNRKFYLKSDIPTNRTDYPHIRSFGERSIQDAERIHKGSMVLVDGIIHTQSFKRNRTCEHCQADYEWSDSSLEIYSLDTEYLSNFLSAEEVEQKNQKELIDIKNRMFE